MTQKHTPGPWIVGRGNRIYMGAAMEAREIAVATRSDPSIRAQAEANAARIVACVNACEGINPEAVPEIVKALGDLLDVVNWLQGSGNMKSPIVPHPFGLGVLGAKAQARAALAKARGET